MSLLIFFKNFDFANYLHTTTEKTTEALIYDAITLFAQTLDDLDRTMPGEITEPHLACNASIVWPFGARIVKHMQGLKIKGVTGLLMFDQFGQRVNFTMDVLQLKAHGLINVCVPVSLDFLLININ